MRFDWLNFVTSNHIPFETRSSNVAKNHIAVRCPFCGSNDPSAHMGLCLDIRRPAWGCWRNKRHSGFNPVWLIVKLLGCSLQRAKEIVARENAAYGAQLDARSFSVSAVAPPGLRRKSKPATMLDAWEFDIGGKLLTKSDENILAKRETLRFPSNIKPINGKGYSDAFLGYLKSRGFDDPYRAVEIGDLHYSLVGRFRNRVIFPVYLGGSLVTYAGRDITGRSDLRYLTLDAEDEIISIKHCLYFEDRIAHGGDVLFVTEGQIDALKLNSYLNPGSLATACFGMPTATQIVKLIAYSELWQHVVVMLDPDQPQQRLMLSAALRNSRTHIVFATLPQGVPDPGALSPYQIRHLAISS